MSDQSAQSIENLNVSEKWKAKFQRIYDAKPISLGIVPITYNIFRFY